MSDLWLDKYAPKTLDDYIGSSYQTILYYIDEFFKGKTGKGFILFGEPGCGKSALINVIANHYDADMYIVNGSDDRNEIDVSSIFATSLLGNKRIVVFEEIDGFNKKRFNELAKIIELSKYPIILICNNIKLIDNVVKSKCYTKQIIVDRFSLKALAKRIIKEEKLNISNDQLNKDLVNITSYRGILDYLQFGSISEIGTFGEAEDLQSMITFTNDNSEEPKMISLADIFYKRSQQGYKNGQIISKYIIDTIDKKSNNYPRTYKLIYEVKKSKSNNGSVKILGFK